VTHKNLCDLIDELSEECAKYSTLGVPYSRKHFDFGAGQGDVLQDVETYFIRIARLRKNYLSN
jgi:hypothetical protein